MKHARIELLPQREAELRLNRKLTSYADLKEAAHSLLSFGAESILLTGDLIPDALFIQGYWTNGQDSFWIASRRMANHENTTELSKPGDVLFSAITHCLKLGYCIKDALVIATMHVNRFFRNPKEPKRFDLNHWPENQEDLPYLSQHPLKTIPTPFKRCRTGLYPVVDRSAWLEQLLPLGVQCIQLRIKDLQGSALEEEIQRSVFLAKTYGAILFINDYWELALRFGAEAVHLGQEDLYEADINAIHQAGMYLGISTHCHYEVAIAHALNPSYIACGPIYPTTSKMMSFDAQGLEKLKSWRRTLHYPLVAIGGINLERVTPILEAGIEGISLISAITKAEDPRQATKELLVRIKEYEHD